MIFLEKMLIFLLILVYCKMTTETDSNPLNSCSKFEGQSPNTILEKCPGQAKFMETDDFECYDKNLRNQ